MPLPKSIPPPLYYGRFGELYKTSKVIDFGICLAQELGFRPSDVTKVSIGDLRAIFEFMKKDYLTKACTNG